MRNIPSALLRNLILVVFIALLVSGTQAQRVQSLTESASSIPPCKQQRNVPDPDHMTRPKYPKEALKTGVEGSVQLRVLVDSSGKAQNVTVVNGEPVFAKPSIEAVHKWKFHPTVVEGKPVETTYKVTVRFVLVLAEAIPDWEIESPRENTQASGSTPMDIRRDASDGPVYKVSEQLGIASPKAVYSPQPEFSEKARQAKEEGTVTLSLVVGTDGKPRDVSVSCSSAPDLNDNAVSAVKSWKFEPGTKDGKPVMVEIAVEIQFHLGL